ncbi:MAG: hypothetical protein C0600_10175, partial [Ignavibacteria bacterium]
MCWAHGYAQHLTIRNDATMRLHGSAVMRIAGDLTAQGSYVSDQASKTVIGGSNDAYITGSIRPGAVSKFGSGTLYVKHGFSTDGFITLNDGNIVTLTTPLTLGTTSRLIGESQSQYVIGRAAANRTVGTGSSDFGGLGCSITSGATDIGDTRLTRLSGPGTAVSDATYAGINRQWWLYPDTDPTGGRTLTFSWELDDDNGKDLTKLQIWKSTDYGVSWSQVGATQDASATRVVTLTGETTLGRYTVSDINNPLTNASSFATNLICDPTPQLITSTTPSAKQTVAVKYLGGASGKVYGLSVRFRFDPTIVS